MAVSVLHRLDFPVAPDTINPFLRSCEHPVFGFTGKPNSSLYFLEYLHAGLALCREMAQLPSHLDACFTSLLRCQTESGGFARTHLAIATMDNTYLAIHGAKLLQEMRAL